MSASSSKSRNAFYQWLSEGDGLKSNFSTAVAPVIASKAQSSQDNSNNCKYSAIASSERDDLNRELEILKAKFDACLSLRLRQDYATFSESTRQHEALALERLEKRISEIQKLLK